MTLTPFLSPLWTSSTWTSPQRAYSRMLRASSEMAVAITARSLPEKPASMLRLRPARRAVTTSASVAMWTFARAGVVVDTIESSALPIACLEGGQAFFQVKRSLDSSQRQPQLHHGERHL